MKQYPESMYPNRNEQRLIAGIMTGSVDKSHVQGFLAHLARRAGELQSATDHFFGQPGMSSGKPDAPQWINPHAVHLLAAGERLRRDVYGYAIEAAALDEKAAGFWKDLGPER